MNQIIISTIAVNRDLIYRYFPYNQKCFGQDQNVDYFLFTDKEEIIDDIVNVPCTLSLCSYTTLLKNNNISNYLNRIDGWNKYSHIFFINADFSIGDYYFDKYDFILVEPYCNNKNGDNFFYVYKTEYSKRLYDLFYTKIQSIYENKLYFLCDLDEFYLGLFREQYKEQIHLIEMDRQTNILIFYDNENLDEKTQQQGKCLFMQPYKAEGRANKTIIANTYNQARECILNLDKQYLFNNYTCDFGRLLKTDSIHYRILWSKKQEVLEVLDIGTLKINRQPSTKETTQLSPVLSIVMPVYNVPPDYFRKSIDSILEQSFGDFELLIIDDGSTELEGMDLIKSYNDQRIRLINNQHSFIATLNRGIAESQGKYIVRMDADDIMLLNRLAVQYEFMEEHPEIDVCGSWVEIFGNGSGVIKTHAEHEQIIASMLLNNPVAHPTVILRKSSVCRNGNSLYKTGYDCAEDYKLWTDLVVRGCRFANIPEVLLRYRKSENQITNTRQKEMYQSTLKIRIEYAEQVMKQIVKKEEKFFDFFERLIELSNEGVIDFKHLSNILYQLHINFH
jgi:glycosyltransferase involved in cell wall biosynthesis